MATKQQCSEMIWRGWHSSRCSRTASVERDGKHYCKQHDPEAVEAKRRERSAAWDAKWAEKSRVARLNAAAPDLLAAARLGAEYDDLLRSYAGPHETLFSGDVLSIDEAYDRWANATRAAIAKATGTA